MLDEPYDGSSKLAERFLSGAIDLKETMKIKSEQGDLGFGTHIGGPLRYGAFCIPNLPLPFFLPMLTTSIRSTPTKPKCEFIDLRILSPA